MWFLLLFLVILGMSLGGRPRVLCHSASCKWNRRGFCSKNQFVVYDNRVKGLCLFHTESMEKRMIEPMQGISGVEVVSNAPESEEQALKDPKVFTKWMSKVYKMKGGPREKRI